MAQDPYKYFRPEARDLVDQFARGVLELEKVGTSAAVVQHLLRLAHTLKGAARVVKQAGIANLAHAIEDTLTPFRDSAETLAPEQIDALLAHLDAISGQLGTLVPMASAEASSKSESDDVPPAVRMDTAEADAVLDGVAEAHALMISLRRAVSNVEQTRHLADMLSTRSAPASSSGHDRDGAQANGRLAVANELRRKLGVIERKLGSTVDRMDRELRQLRDTAERLRLVSTRSMFTALERTARDTAAALTKQVVFAGTGSDIRIDPSVLEKMQNALIQIIRNAVAHGIESESERRSAGKHAVGRITVTVSRRNSRIVFACSDDGRGVDLNALRRVATQRGLVGAALKDPTSDDLIRLLLRGGISTARTVTDISGRGIGLDVVREAVERLGGEIGFHTAPGAGTTFELIIPPSLASMEALIVPTSATGRTAAIPLDAVRSALRLSSTEISHAATGASVLYDGKAIAFIPLTTALSGKTWAADRAWTVMIVAGAGGLAVIGVKRLLGTARIVVRPLPKQMTASPIVLGAALDADGTPQLVLDPDGLVTAAQRERSFDPMPPAKPPLLVVDDSSTTRMLERSILESAGYDVDVAVSGEEALDLVRNRNYGLILCDVEMPGIDGFTFVERIRRDPISRDIPAILVTSRAEPQDRDRGRAVGAQGYIVKSEFDQTKLLSMIGPLLRAS